MAKKKSLSYLPKYKNFRKTGYEVCVEVTTSGLPLRQIMRDRDLLKKHSQKIICGLVNCELQLSKKKVVLRTIQPSTVFYD